MSLPQLIVEVGFTGPTTGDYLILNDVARGKLDTGTWGPDDLWTNITTWVRAMGMRRGSTRIESPIFRYEAGTCTVELDNSDRRFDPTNTSGPYVAAGITQVEPRRPVRVRATWAGATYDLFRGHADRWLIGYDKESPFFSLAVLPATDGIEILQNNNRAASASAGAGEDTGQRVIRILNSASWPNTDQLISVGNTTVQATTLEGSAWDELLVVQDTEIGEIYIDATGNVVFRNRQAVLEDARSAFAMACFGDQPVTGVQTTINMARNPSIETDTSGWGAGGSVPPTLTQSSAQAKFGTKSLLATWGTGGTFPLVGAGGSVMTPRVGLTYTASVYVYVPSGSPDVAIVLAGVGVGMSTGLKDQWVRLSFTNAATASLWDIQIWPVTSPTAGQQVYIDGFQVEEGGTATTYCDGTQANCEWDGPNGLSSSRRIPELPYFDVGIDNDDTTLANRIRVTRVGGTEQLAESAISQAKYTIKTWSPPAQPIMETDAAALDWANYILYQTKNAELRFSTLTLRPQRDENNLFPQALGRELGDRIRIIRRPPGGGTITRECIIRGISHFFDGETWATEWLLQSASKLSFLVLDNNTLGKLDENAWGF